jgi:hypothetical protein
MSGGASGVVIVKKVVYVGAGRGVVVSSGLEIYVVGSKCGCAHQLDEDPAPLAECGEVEGEASTRDPLESFVTVNCGSNQIQDHLDVSFLV